MNLNKSSNFEDRIKYHENESKKKLARYFKEQNRYDLHSALYHETIAKDMNKKNRFLSPSEYNKIYHDFEIVL